MNREHVPSSAGARWRSLALPAGLFIVAAALRLWRLGVPEEEIPLDERHYIPDARDVLEFGTESSTRSDTPFVVHPPAGKWFIAAGMRLFGSESAFGWRFSGAVIGALGVLLVYLIGRRLWDARWAATLAGGLLALDGLWFVHSRVAMLDIYPATFGLLTLWLLLEDRARTPPTHRGVRPWRLAAGVAAGITLATKWAGIPTVALLAAFGMAWEFRRLRARAGPEPEAAAPQGPEPEAAALRLRRTLTIGRGVAAAGAALLLLPGVIYVATFLPWFLHEDRYLPPRCAQIANPAAGWVCYQREMANFHRNLQKFKDDGPGHPYFSEVWSWPFAGRPVVHHFRSEGAGDERRNSHILGLPNPAVWVPGWLSLPLLGWWAWRRRPGNPAGPLAAAREAGHLERAPPGAGPPPAAPRERDGIAWLLIALAGVNYLIYLIPGLFDRPAFLFYAVPMLPFMVLGLVHVLQRGAAQYPWVRPAAVALAVAAVVLFIYFYPVLSGVLIPHEGFFGWQGRMWLTADCTASETIRNLCWI